MRTMLEMFGPFGLAFMASALLAGWALDRLFHGPITPAHYMAQLVVGTFIGLVVQVVWDRRSRVR